MNERQKAEKKAQELLPEMKYDCLSGGVENIENGAFNKAIYFSRNVVADLLMREAELEWELKATNDSRQQLVDKVNKTDEQLSASQKRVEELDIILKHSKEWSDDIYDKYESLKQSQCKKLSKSDIKLILENTGLINKETHKLEHDLFEIDICINKLFESQGKVLRVEEIIELIRATPRYSWSPYECDCLRSRDAKILATAIHDKMMEENE